MKETSEVSVWENKERRIQPVALGLYAFCKATYDHYWDLNMEIEAGVFEAYLKRIEDKFSTNNIPPD